MFSRSSKRFAPFRQWYILKQLFTSASAKVVDYCDFSGGVVSVLCERENFGIVAGTYELKSIFCGVYHLTVLVYTETTIRLSVDG